MTERELQDAVTELATLLGFDVYHTHDSRHSAAGFPDLVLMHERRQVVLFRELKTELGAVSPEQARWLDGLRRAGYDTGVWRPREWLDGTVERELRESHPMVERVPGGVRITVLTPP